MAERLQRRPESPDSNCPEAATLAPSVPRVRRSRRKPVPSELIVSTLPAPNNIHPLSGMGGLERKNRRIAIVATVPGSVPKPVYSVFG